MSTQIVDAVYVQEHLGEVPIIDLRPEFMFDAYHIPDSNSIDFWFLKTQNGFTLPVRLSQFLNEKGIGLNDPVIIMCQSGQMSTEACEMLEDQGYTELRHYAAGWADWASDKSRPRSS